MPTIKSNDWLKDQLKKNNMTQVELANRIDLSVNAISKIVRGERLGSPETWDKIYEVLGNGPNTSVSSQDMIRELKEEISIYGQYQEVTVYYYVKNGNIIFCDYLMDEDMQKHGSDKDLKKLNNIRITLLEALELFENQNKLI